MTVLTSDPTIIMADPSVGSGSARIIYYKGSYEEIYYRIGATDWIRANLNALTGREGDEPLSKGRYSITLRPGEVYEVGAFPLDHGPTTSDPIYLAHLKVFCLLKAPVQQRLIMDTNEMVGGTFYWNRILTTQPTNIVEIGVSEQALVFDTTGLQRLLNRQDPISPTFFTTDHASEFTPLLAGHHYFFVAIVVDAFGNWEQKVMELDTLQRTVTVDFPEVIVNNDGDESTSGQAELWFTIYDGDDVVKTFNRPTAVVDDWSESGLSYPLADPDGSPFHHVIGPQSAIKGKDSIKVHVHGREYDAWPEPDEIARMPFPARLPIPHGRFTEVVSNQVLWFRCYTGGINDFNFSAKVVFSVNYPS